MPPVIHAEPTDRENTVALSGWCGATGNYERFQTLQAVPANAQALTFGRKNRRSTDRLVGPTYTLRLYDTNDALLRSFVRTVTPYSVADASFTADFSGLNGWVRASIECPYPEKSPSWFIYVKGGGPAPAQMPVVGGSFDIFHDSAQHHWALVPAAFDPTIVPLPARERPAFSAPVDPAQLYREYLVPMKADVDIVRTVKSAEGIVHTNNYQSYAYASLVSQFPSTSLLDGPRGRGAIGMPTHLAPGRNEKTYFSDPWRFGKITPDGTITTLVGWRHGGAIPGDKRNNTSALELVGDWSAVADKGTWGMWGWCWLPSTLATDPNQPPIGGEPPHVGTGPVLILADTYKGRLLKVQFDGHDRSKPGVVTVLVSGLFNPWDVVADDNDVIYVAEQTAHRIVAYDGHTGAKIRVVTQGAALAHVDASKFVVRDGSLAAIRSQPCVAPEGLFLQDGVLSFGSFAMQQIREITLATGANVPVAEPDFDSNSRFVKIARSDGTFMARGTYFASTWSSRHFGMPEAIGPNGVRYRLRFDFDGEKALSQGRGGHWEAMGYAAAVGVGNGRLIFASSMEGVAQMSLALPTDPAPNYAQYMAGFRAWLDAGLHKVYGFHGFGYYGLPKPEGLPAAIDYYLTVNGTNATQPEDPAVIAQLQADLAAAVAALQSAQANAATLQAEIDALTTQRDQAVALLAAAVAKIDAAKAALA